MIFSLTGTISHLQPNGLVLDVHGVGYAITTTPSLLADAKIGDQRTLYTYHHIREDEESLYGFDSLDQLELFRSIISVSKIGPKIGLLILSAASYDRLVAAIASGDTAILSAVPGVGKKTAERVILELRDKVSSLTTAADGSKTGGGAKADALDALLQLGYSTAEARTALDAIGSAEVDLSAQIKAALQYLGRGQTR